MPSRRAAALLVAAALVAAPSPAATYSRQAAAKLGAPTARPEPYRWGNRCITVEPDLRGGLDLSARRLEQALTRAAARWNDAVRACSAIELIPVPPRRALGADREDGVNTLSVVDGSWLAPGEGRTSSSQLAVTRLTGYSAPREVLAFDADIVLNGDALRREGSQLEDVLTHELGHVLGFGHSCRLSGEAADASLDDDGQPVPPCDESVGPRSVMHPQLLFGGEVADEDVRGVCALYAARTRDTACFPVVVGGCAVGDGARRPQALWLVVVALCLRAGRRARSITSRAGGTRAGRR